MLPCISTQCERDVLLPSPFITAIDTLTSSKEKELPSASSSSPPPSHGEEEEEELLQMSVSLLTAAIQLRNGTTGTTASASTAPPWSSFSEPADIFPQNSPPSTTFSHVNDGDDGDDDPSLQPPVLEDDDELPPIIRHYTNTTPPPRPPPRPTSSSVTPPPPHSSNNLRKRLLDHDVNLFRPDSTHPFASAEMCRSSSMIDFEVGGSSPLSPPNILLPPKNDYGSTSSLVGPVSPRIMTTSPRILPGSMATSPVPQLLGLERRISSGKKSGSRSMSTTPITTMGQQTLLSPPQEGKDPRRIIGGGGAILRHNVGSCSLQWWQW